MLKKDNKIAIISPDEALTKFLEWFDINKRIALLTAFIVGIITHITFLTEMIMSQDGLWNSIQYARAGNWELTLGRWGIELIGRLTSFIAIPTVTAVFCILAMSITAVVWVELFDLKSKISIIFTALSLVLAPALATTLLYIYTSVAYAFNMLFSSLVILFIYKIKNKKRGTILGMLAFMLSLSIYQSYIGVTVGLCIIMSIMYLLKNEKTLKKIFFKILQTVLTVIFGGILYLFITTVLLNISGLELASYKGASNANIFNTFTNLKSSIFTTYKDFFEYYFGDEIVFNSNYMRQKLFFVLFSVLSLGILLKLVKLDEQSKKMKVIKIVLVIFFMIVLPIGLNIVDIIVNTTKIYVLTSAQMVLIIPFSFAIMETLEKGVLLKWSITFSCLLIMISYYIAINTSYTALKLTYNQAYSTTMRIMDRIENTTGYSKDNKILFGGIVGNNNYPRTSNLYGYTLGSIFNNVTFHGTYGGQIGTWLSFMKIFYGVDLELCSEEVYYNIVKSKDYEDMEIFPSQNSIKIMNGIVVIKLSDDPPLPY